MFLKLVGHCVEELSVHYTLFNIHLIISDKFSAPNFQPPTNFQPQIFSLTLLFLDMYRKSVPQNWSLEVN